MGADDLTATGCCCARPGKTELAREYEFPYKKLNCARERARLLCFAVPDRGQRIWHPFDPRGRGTGWRSGGNHVALIAHALHILVETKRPACTNLSPGREVVGNHEDPGLFGFDHGFHLKVGTALLTSRTQVE